MPELDYNRLLQAVHLNKKRTGISTAASTALDKVMKYPHPTRELAFLGWALCTDLSPQVANNESNLERASPHY